MCLGVPGRLLERSPMHSGHLAGGLVEFDGLRRQVCLELVPDAAIGDYVLVHAGIAINSIDALEAERLLQHLRAIGEDEFSVEPSS